MSSEKGRMFSHLKWKDRLKIEKMLKEKKSKSEIARTLRVDYTTVMREIKRGLTIQRDTNLVDREVYCAETAERKYRENLRAKGPDIKLGNDHELAQYIEGKIADGICQRIFPGSCPAQNQGGWLDLLRDPLKVDRV